jgi:hypothetical protein
MRRSAVRTALFFGAGVLATGSLVTPVNAQSFPSRARLYSTHMARAFDVCTPGGLTVLTPNLPASGCVAANSVTDNTTLMNWARLTVSKTGRIKLVARGFTFGDAVRVRLHMRITRRGVLTKHPPSTNNTVTFSDVIVDCPPSPDAYVVRPNGAIGAATTLASCLAPNAGLASGLTNGNTLPNNIEILGASLVSVLSGKELARSGIVR